MRKEEKKTIVLDYEFDSWYDEDYEEYDGDEFEYEIDIDEAKEIIVESYIDLVSGDKKNIVEFVKILNELHDEELIEWENIFDKDENQEYLKDHFKKDAMEWFVEQNYIMTKEDYEANQADAYNDDKWLREHGE